MARISAWEDDPLTEPSAQAHQPAGAVRPTLPALPVRAVRAQAGGARCTRRAPASSGTGAAWTRSCARSEVLGERGGAAYETLAVRRRTAGDARSWCRSQRVLRPRRAQLLPLRPSAASSSTAARVPMSCATSTATRCSTPVRPRAVERREHRGRRAARSVRRHQRDAGGAAAAVGPHSSCWPQTDGRLVPGVAPVPAGRATGLGGAADPPRRCRPRLPAECGELVLLQGAGHCCRHRRRPVGLSSEPHSFSRVFTAAWLESFAAMVERAGRDARRRFWRRRATPGRCSWPPCATRESRRTTSRRSRPTCCGPRRGLFGGRDQDGIRAAFVRRGILSVGIGRVGRRPDPDRGPADAPWVPPPTAAAPTECARARERRPVRPARARGCGGRARWTARRSVAASAALDLGSRRRCPAGTGRAGVRRGAACAGGASMPERWRPGTPPPCVPARTTHRLVRDGRHVRLVRGGFTRPSRH